MKRISILLLTVLLFKLSQAQVTQFPQVYYYGADPGNPELIIRSSNSSSSSAITELSLTAKIGADALFTNSSDPYEMNWVRVSLPSTSSTNNSPNYGYLRCNEFYGKINSTNNYATVSTTSDPLGVRTCAGCTSSYVTSSGQSIFYGKNSILSLTGSTSSGWYEIYLPNGTGGYPMAFSQPTGWVNGQYLSFPSSQSYKIIGGRVCDGSGNCTIIGNVNQATITYSGLGTTRSGSGSYEYKVPTNWNGTLTCSHPSYNSSSPASYSISASSNNYSKHFILSNCTTPNAPTISSCSGANANSFTANWSSVSGATKYYLDVSTNSSFSSFVSGYNNLDVGNVITKSVTSLSANTTYYYRVRVYTCALSANSSYSTCQTTTSCSTPNAPTISSCSGTNANSFTANWSSVSSATKYYLDVSTTSSFSSFVSGYNNLDVGNVITKSVNGLNANTTYYYRVRVYTCAMSSNSSYSSCQTTTSCSTPNAPTISSCSGANTNSFTANWSTVAGATKYYLDVSTTSSFSSFVSGYNNLDVGNVITKSVTGLNINTTYYYRVRVYTCALSSNSSYSTCQTTTSCITPNAPTISSCSGANTNSFTANWSAVAGATKYYLDVSTSSSFSSFVSGYNNLDVGNVVTKSVTGLSTSTTYYYRVRVYTCAMSGNSGNGNCTTISNTPSQVIINNIIKNNTRFSNPKLLWSGYTNQTPDIIKICADASNATEIIFTNNTGVNSNNIRFLIASDPSGNNSDKSGYFIRDAQNLSINGNTIKNKLTHPKYLEPQYKPSRVDTIIVVDVNNTNVRLFSIPIQIYRAPVVLVHGFTGGDGVISEESFHTTKDFLFDTGNYLWNFIRVVNYHTTSYQSFNVNQYVVPNNINNIIDELIFNKISCGKVDVVGFSMGGCLSRIYLQSNAYSEKNDIHKLITINTPHFGSQWGNLFKNNRTRPVVLPLLNTLIRFDLGADYINEDNYGAVYDLSVNSQAMNNLLNSPSNLNKSTVPTHTIGSTFSYTNRSHSIIEDVIRAVFILDDPLFSSFNSFTENLFINLPHDGAVRLNSQSGGLSSMYFSQYPDQFHLGANKNTYIMSELSNALNINSSNTNYFTQAGFVPTVQQSNYRLSQPDTFNQESIIQQGFITFNYPLDGQYFTQNSSLPISINSNNGINRLLLASIGNTGSDILVDTLLSNGIINFSVPSNAFGKISFVVLGYNNNDFIDYDTVTININQTSILDSITTYSTPIYLQELYTGYVDLKAYYNDGNAYTVYNNDGVQYSLADTNIAKYYYGNLIYGKKKGSTILTVSYGSKSIDIPVFVTDRDTTIGDLPENIITAIKKNPINNALRALKVFPNPTTGEFTLQADVETGEQIRIEVFNQIGQSVLLKEDKSTAKNYVKNISVNHFSSGVYYIILSTKTANYTNKIMLTK